jgi:hypothetical protein
MHRNGGAKFHDYTISVWTLIGYAVTKVKIEQRHYDAPEAQKCVRHRGSYTCYRTESKLAENFPVLHAAPFASETFLVVVPVRCRAYSGTRVPLEGIGQLKYSMQWLKRSVCNVSNTECL